MPQPARERAPLPAILIAWLLAGGSRTPHLTTVQVWATVLVMGAITLDVLQQAWREVPTANDQRRRPWISKVTWTLFAGKLIAVAASYVLVALSLLA